MYSSKQIVELFGVCSSNIKFLFEGIIENCHWWIIRSNLLLAREEVAACVAFSGSV